MPKYIESEALLKSENWQSLKSDFDKARAHIIILGQPAADVVEVKHGYWKETITHNGCTWDSDCVCSVCGKSGHPCNNYCEECGAKMDGKGIDNG